MATLTSLGFSIFSTYDGSGVRRASRDINDLNSTVNRTSGGLNSFTGRLTAVTSAAIALGPALLPIGEAAVSVTGTLTAMGVVAGSALGIYAAATHGAITRTLEMAEAGQKLTASQTQFVSAVNNMKGAWTDFIVSTQDMTLSNATIVVNALTRAIGFLAPVVRAVNPLVRETALAFASWVDRADGLQRFIDLVIQFGVPALTNLTHAGRDVLAVLGIAFRALLPLVIPLSEWIARGAAALRSWAEGGGFDRFVDRVQQNGPQVAEFFRQLWAAFGNILQIVRELAPLSLELATNLLRIVAGMNPQVVAAAAAAFLILKGALTGLMLPAIILRGVFGMGTGITGLFTTLVPLVLRLAGIIGLFVGAVILAWQHSAFFREQVAQLWQQIQILWRDHLQPLIQKLQELWDKLEPVRMIIGLVAGLIGGLFVNMLTNALVVVGGLADGLGRLIGVLNGIITWITEGGLGQLWDMLWNGMRTTVDTVWQAIQIGWQNFLNFLTNTWNTWSSAFVSFFQQIWEGIRSWVSGKWQEIQQHWNDFLNWIRNLWNSWSSSFVSFFQSVWEGVRSWVSQKWQEIQQHWQDFLNWIRNLWNSWSSSFVAFFQQIWEGVRSWVSQKWQEIQQHWQDFLNWVRDRWNDFSSAFETAWRNTWETVRDIAADLWEDIIGVVEDAINALLTPINMLIDGFNNIGNVFGLPDIPNISVNFAYGGMVGSVPGFANGGVMNLRHGGAVPGYSPGRDRVPAMLSPGEGVLVPEAVRGLGGPSFIRGANNHFSHGRTGSGGPSISQLGFANGGVAGVQHFAVGGITAAALARAGVGLGMVTQGEFSNGALSAGTHLGGGVVDLGTTSPAVLARLISAGFAAWIRGPAQGFAPHIHAVLIGHPQLSGPAQAQVASFLAGGSGLGVGGGGGGFNIADLFGDIGELLKKVFLGSSLADAIGGGGDDGGGIGGIIGSVIGTIADLFTPGGGGVGGMMTDLLFSLVEMSHLDVAFSPFQEALDALNLGDHWFADMLIAASEWLLKGAKDFIISEKPESFNPADFAGAFGSGGTAQWAPLAAIALARAGLSASQLPAFLALMAAESGGNPMAINLTDSNAANGDPSRGLMQVIGATFAAYRDPSLPNNIFDPLANMVAAARYIAARYGGNVPGSPYGIGTPGGHRGWHIVGEYGPEWMNFRGGERVGSNQDLRDAISGAGGRSWDGDININFYGNPTEGAVRYAEGKLVPKLRAMLQQKAGTR